MNSSPDNFDQLRKLLVLKRYERPPPGFFNHFSDKVIARVEADGLTTRVSWWQRLFLNLEAKPVLACAYGLMVGGLLVVGMSISRTAESEETGAPVLANPGFAARPVSVSMTPVPEPGTRHLENPTDRSSSVTPVVSSGAPSPFFEIPRLKTERASFTLP